MLYIAFFALKEAKVSRRAGRRKTGWRGRRGRGRGWARERVGGLGGAGGSRRKKFSFVIGGQGIATCATSENRWEREGRGFAGWVEWVGEGDLACVEKEFDLLS